MTCHLYFRCKAAFALPIAYPDPRGRVGEIFCGSGGHTGSASGLPARSGDHATEVFLDATGTTAMSLQVCSSAHNLACLAATPARSSSTSRNFHLSTSFAAWRERRSARASIRSAWMRCCVGLSGLPAGEMIKQFYESYRGDSIVSALRSQLSWTHHRIIQGT